MAYIPGTHQPHPMQLVTYQVYHPGPHGQEGGPMFMVPHGTIDASGMSPPQVYYNHQQSQRSYRSHVFNKVPTRKESADSGVSEFSSRKNSSVSSSSRHSFADDLHVVSQQLQETKIPEQPFVNPDDELCEKIVAQVEFYFGDANITKDKFLLKHVKRNKEGYVSLKLISSFKRVKHLTKDWRQVAYAIPLKSSKLEVNPEKTKVRRKDPLPEYDETTPSRTVVALNLPLERPTIEAVAEIFSGCGEIVLVRILRPGNPIPADVKQFANKHPEMTAKVCALVEYERTEFAHKAVKELSHSDDDGEASDDKKMIVMELTASPPKSNKAKDNKRRPLALSDNAPQTRRISHSGFGQYGYQQSQQESPRRRVSLYHNMKFSPIMEEAPRKTKEMGLNPNAPTFTMQNCFQRKNAIFLPPNNQPAGIMVGLPPAAAPWHAPTMRRMMPVSGVEVAASGLALPPNVMRLPDGPEKTNRGFERWRRQRREGSVQRPVVVRKSRAVQIVAPPPEEKKVEKSKQENEDGNEVDVVVAIFDGPDQIPAEEAAGAAAAPVIPPPADAQQESDSDEGHFSEGEEQQVHVQPQGPGFAAAMSPEKDEEHSR